VAAGLRPPPVTRRAAAAAFPATLRAVPRAMSLAPSKPVGTRPERGRIRKARVAPATRVCARIDPWSGPDNQPRGAFRMPRSEPSGAAKSSLAPADLRGPCGPGRNPGEPRRPGLADLAVPQGVDGTSSSEHSRQRPGDGASPGVLSGAKITPEPPEVRPAGRGG
jgi:hypothetical protein